MDNDKKINENEQEPKPKRRRTAEEIAAERLARERRLNEDAEAAKANITEMEKQIAEYQLKIEEARKKLTSNRNAIRTHKAMKLYGDLIAMLGYESMEKACATESDFDKLAELVKYKVQSLIRKK